MVDREEDRKIHVRLTEELHRRLRVRCAELHTTIQDWVVGLLERELGGRGDADRRGDDRSRAVDAQLRHPEDQPSIGRLLCKSKNRLIVEYALRDVHKPIGVAEWETRRTTSLPEDLKGTLPTVEEIEAELGLAAKREDTDR